MRVVHVAMWGNIRLGSTEILMQSWAGALKHSKTSVSIVEEEKQECWDVRSVM